MTEYNLTPKQKLTLRKIVESLKAGTVKEPLITVITNEGAFIIGIKEKFDRNLRGDLEILCEADLLGFHYNSKGDKLFTVKQKGYNLINGFTISSVSSLNAEQSERNQVFISYSHLDKEWLQRVRIHLKPFERNYKINVWDDTKINTGQDWKNEINNALEKTKVAVLLVSASFLASDFIATDELPPLLNTAAKGGAVIIQLF